MLFPREAKRKEKNVQQVARTSPTGGRLSSILTDIHFWVPLAVLIGGLLILRAIS
jgi:hypothetical protein